MAANADGSVVVDVQMNVSDAEKELSRLKQRVFKLEGEIEEKEYNRNILVQRRREILSEIAELRKSMSPFDGDKFADNSAVESKIASLREEAAGLQKEITKYDDALDKSNIALDYTKLRYGEIVELSKQITASQQTPQSERLRMITEAENKLSALRAQGKWFGDNEYDEAYRNLSLLNAELREYQRNLSKTPAQLQKETEIEEQRQSQIAKEASAAIEAQIAQQRLLDIKESAAVADKRLVDIQEELATLTARRKELEEAGAGLGYKEYDQISARIAEINREIKEYQDNLTRSAGETENVANSTNLMAEAVKKAQDFIGRFANRVIGLAKRVFVFTLISSAFRSLRTYIGNAIKASDEATASIARLKAAFLTMLQPLLGVIIPAFITLANVLAKIATVIAGILSPIFGKTFQQSKEAAKGLNAESKAIKGVGAAAEEAAGSLAGFDEINTIDTGKASGGAGGGGGGGIADIEPDFSWADGLGDLMDRLAEISDLVMMIGAGLALWKLGSVLPGILGQIATVLGGILLTLGGILLYWDGLMDAIKNGVNWFNLIEMIGGLAAAALGLYILLGPLAAGIALVVGGLGMLITGFRDAMKNGWKLENVLTSIAGMLAAGLGIALITGSWIPLLIAGIASALLALTVATGHGEELIKGIKSVMEGFIDFFTGIFTGDIKKTIGGIEKIFDGLKIAIFAIIDGIKDSFLSFLGWLDEKTKGRFHGIIELAKSLVTTFYESTKKTLGNVLNAVKQIFTWVVQFFSGVFTNNWDKAWEGIKNIFKGAWNVIVSLLEGASKLIDNIIRKLWASITSWWKSNVARYFKYDYWSQLGRNMVNGLLDGLKSIFSGLSSWASSVWNTITNTFSRNNAKATVSGGISTAIGGGAGRTRAALPDISTFNIPALARGAVIPANREFLAVLGDQKSGTNIEAPLSTIEQALENVLARNGNSSEINITVQLDGRVVARNTIRHINDMTRAAGKPVLLI